MYYNPRAKKFMQKSRRDKKTPVANVRLLKKFVIRKSLFYQFCLSTLYQKNQKYSDGFQQIGTLKYKKYLVYPIKYIKHYKST